MKFLAATVLLCVTGFCVFGFLASFEIGPISLWQGLYGACGIGTCAVAMWLLLHRTLARTLGTLALLAVVIFCVVGFVESRFTYPFPWQVVGGGALGCGCLTAVIALLRRRGDNSKPMGTLALFAATVFCVLGFMESYRGFPWPWWVGYGALGCSCLGGGVELLRQGRGSSKPQGDCGARSNFKSLKWISIIGFALTSVGLGGMLLAHSAYPDSNLLGGWGLILGPIYWLGLPIFFVSVLGWIAVGLRRLWRKSTKRGA